MKELLSFFTTIIAALCCLTCSYAINVNSVSELMGLFDGQSQGAVTFNINLLVDIDFSTAKMLRPLGGKASGACVTFNGVLSGNGHTIRGLDMDNKDKSYFKDAGLFCELGNATVTDLVIDGSCRFVGQSAGALAASVAGTVNVRNVTNHAAVTGGQNAGGLIGNMMYTKKVSLSLEGCTNYGSVTGTYVSTQNRAGGLIGFLRDNEYPTITIYDCANYGQISGTSTYCGGLIGYLFGNSEYKIDIQNCSNYGNVNGIDYASGIISVFWENVHGEVKMIGVKNFGKITGQKEVGGMIGSVGGSSDISVTIKGCTNAGFISGLSYVGGFIGSFTSRSNYYAILNILSCNNLGDVNANSEISCGFFCHKTTDTNSKLNMRVENVVNKGKITGEKACGISNSLTGAIVLANLGEVEKISGFFFTLVAD